MRNFILLWLITIFRQEQNYINNITNFILRIYFYDTKAYTFFFLFFIVVFNYFCLS